MKSHHILKAKFRMNVQKTHRPNIKVKIGVLFYRSKPHSCYAYNATNIKVPGGQNITANCICSSEHGT